MSGSNKTDAGARIQCLHDWIADAARVAADAFGSIDRAQMASKPAGDLVTTVETRIEQSFRDRIAARFPSDTLLGEEYGLTGEKEADFVWVLDPIDGTANFATGIPYFCCVGGLVQNGQMIAAVISDPIRNEVIVAQVNKGVKLNGNTFIRPKIWPEGARAHFGLGYSDTQEICDYMIAFATLRDSGMLPREFCAGALMITDTALGRFAGYFEALMHYWDAAPALLIAREAGLETTDFPFGDYQTRHPVLAVDAAYSRLGKSLLEGC